jgi:hypothetical protein
VLDRLKAEAEERQHLDPKGGLEVAEIAMEVGRRIGTLLPQDGPQSSLIGLTQFERFTPASGHSALLCHSELKQAKLAEGGILPRSRSKKPEFWQGNAQDSSALSASE